MQKHNFSDGCPFVATKLGGELHRKWNSIANSKTAFARTLQQDILLKIQRPQFGHGFDLQAIDATLGRAREEVLRRVAEGKLPDAHASVVAAGIFSCSSCTRASSPQQVAVSGNPARGLAYGCNVRRGGEGLQRERLDGRDRGRLVGGDIHP
jgi:hypothetical protein